MKNKNNQAIGIIDIEASGLHFDSYPIEVAVRLRGECMSWLIKPEPGWQYWNATAESMHGISREELLRDGLPAAEVVEQLNAFLGELHAVLYSDAHRWDGDWINTLYCAVNAVRPFRVASIYELIGNRKRISSTTTSLDWLNLDDTDTIGRLRMCK